MSRTKHRRLLRNISIGTLICLTLLLAAAWEAGTVLTRPAYESVGYLPGDLPGETVTFASASGANLRGWFVPGTAGHGAVVLLHGLRGNRGHMLDRARLLHGAGYAVLLFDFQAHGESTGGQKQITFGYRESMDARAGVEYMRSRLPGERIGVIGVSLGGAAALLADPPLPVQAMVLEMVYPTLTDAVADRMGIWLGPGGAFFAPLLTLQVRPRLSVSPDRLRPEEYAARVSCPKLFIVGAEDRHTPLAESRRLFARARAPKELWVVPHAEHENLYTVAGQEYERRVLHFFERTLRQ